MAKYIPYDYNQNLMVVINFQDQLQPGTFEYALHYLVTQRLDLSIFAEAYKNDEQGRPAYDPAILLKIILFAYSKGITSSREIQWCCETNILFKALSCDSVPHFTTIAAFVSGYPTQIEKLFEPPRISRRLQPLREWSNERENVKPLFIRNPRTSHSHGARTSRRICVGMGGYSIDFGQIWLYC